MEQERNFWLVGGDGRQKALARLLREDGHTVHISGLDGGDLPPEPLGSALSLAHCVILPLPVLDREGFLHTPLFGERLRLEDVLERMEPGQRLCGGMVPPEVERAAKSRGLRLFDYYAREECMVANAVPTAAGIGRTAPRIGWRERGEGCAGKTARGGLLPGVH